MFTHRSSAQLVKVASYFPHHTQFSSAPVVGLGPASVGEWVGLCTTCAMMHAFRWVTCAGGPSSCMTLDLIVSAKICLLPAVSIPAEPFGGYPRPSRLLPAAKGSQDFASQGAPAVGKCPGLSTVPGETAPGNACVVRISEAVQRMRQRSNANTFACHVC